VQAFAGSFGWFVWQRGGAYEFLVRKSMVLALKSATFS